MVVSFVVVRAVRARGMRRRTYPRNRSARQPARAMARHPVLALCAQARRARLFIVTIVAGFRGDQNPYRNIAPTLVWIIWWVGLAYVSAFVGNLWALINPWRTIFDRSRPSTGGSPGGPAVAGGLPYPEALGVWPACVLLLAFAWIELVYPNRPCRGTSPGWPIAYSALTLAGMLVFGASLAARTARCSRWCSAPSPASRRSSSHGARPAAAAAVRRRAARRAPGVDLDDGLRAAAAGDRALRRRDRHRRNGAARRRARRARVRDRRVQLGDPDRRPRRLLARVPRRLSRRLRGHERGGGGALAARDGAASPSRWSRSRSAITSRTTSCSCWSRGKYIIPLASDPFGFGWNLFGTAGYRVDIALVDARFRLVRGGDGDPHRTRRGGLSRASQGDAGVRAAPRRAALAGSADRADGGLYLREPVHHGRADRRAPRAAAAVGVAAEIAVPADAVLPEPGGGCSRSAPASARQKLTYRVMGSAFHDGTQHDRRRSPLCLHVRLSLGRARRGRTSASDPLVAAATAVLRAQLVGVRVVGIDTRRNRSGSATSNFVRELFVVEVYTSTSRRRCRSRTRSWRRPGARCPGISSC